MLLIEPVKGSTRSGHETCDASPIYSREPRQNSATASSASATAAAQATVASDDEQQLSSIYQDEEINCALRNIADALPNCHPDHQMEIVELCRRSHEAVAVVREFRAEVLAKTKKMLLHDEEDEARLILKGNTVLLEPGKGPEALREALGRVLEYMEGKFRIPVEAERCQILEEFKEEEEEEEELRSDRKRPRHNDRVGEETDEAMRQVMAFGISLAPTQATRSAGKPLTIARLGKKLTKAVRLHMEGVVESAEVKLKAAYHLCGPRDFQKVGAIALVALCQLNEAVFKSVEGVNESVELGYKTMNSFGNRLRVQPCLVRESIEARKQREEMGAAVTEIGAGVAAIGAGVKDIGADVKFIGADLKDTLKRVKNLEGEIDDVLKALNGVRIDHNKGRCPRGFFLVPTDKTAWSWVKQVDCFSLYTKNVDLFFVCRLFFEELKKKTQAERNSLTPLSSQYDHELADPIQLQLPRDAVVKRLHVIRLSAKILKVLVTASTVGLPVGNLVPDLSYLDQDKLLEAVSSHLAAAEKLAADGEPAKKMNLLQELTGPLKKFLKMKEKPMPLAEASEALQGYLDKKHPGVWQDKVHPKLEVIANANKDHPDHAYICKKDNHHEDEWKART